MIIQLCLLASDPLARAEGKLRQSVTKMRQHAVERRVVEVYLICEYLPTMIRKIEAVFNCNEIVKATTRLEFRTTNALSPDPLLFSVLSMCTSLGSLRLAGIFLRPQEIALLVPILAYLEVLKQLSLTRNSLGDSGVKKIPAKVLVKLNEVRIEDNYIGNDGVVHLTKELRTSSKLQVLSLDGNRIGRDGVFALVENFEGMELKELSMRGNPLTGMKLGEVLCYMPQCKNLLLGGHPGPKLAPDVASDGCVRNTMIEGLILNGAKLGKEGVPVVLRSMRTCLNLGILQMSGNDIKDEGVEALVKLLWCIKNIWLLNLGQNGISDAGFKALTESLAPNCPRLEVLGLSKNEIEMAPGVFAVQELGECKNLHSLNVDGNKLGVKGVKALLEQIEHWPAIKSLDVRDNQLLQREVQDIQNEFPELLGRFTHCML